MNLKLFLHSPLIIFLLARLLCRPPDGVVDYEEWLAMYKELGKAINRYDKRGWFGRWLLRKLHTMIDGEISAIETCSRIGVVIIRK